MSLAKIVELILTFLITNEWPAWRRFVTNKTNKDILPEPDDRIYNKILRFSYEYCFYLVN